MNVAIIPARGGSKRIPNKNIRNFAGHPIIYYSIEAAVKSGLFEKVIVSTDSEEIARISRGFGAEVPFMRPSNLSDDHSTIASVLSHALDFLIEKGFNPSYLCGILPTAPFIHIDDISRGYSLIVEKKVSSVIPVTTFDYPIFRSLKINSTGSLEMIWPEHKYSRSNDLLEAYHDCGQFYWLNCRSFLSNREIFTADAFPLQLPRYRVCDIDTDQDWKMAELMYKNISISGEEL